MQQASNARVAVKLPLPPGREKAVAFILRRAELSRKNGIYEVFRKYPDKRQSEEAGAFV